jgi:hypothetical protein
LKASFEAPKLSYLLTVWKNDLMDLLLDTRYL